MSGCVLKFDICEGGHKGGDKQCFEILQTLVSDFSRSQLEIEPALACQIGGFYSVGDLIQVLSQAKHVLLPPELASQPHQNKLGNSLLKVNCTQKFALEPT